MFYVVSKQISYPFKNGYDFSMIAEVKGCVEEKEHLELETDSAIEAYTKCRMLNIEQIKNAQARIERAKIEIADYQQLLSENEKILEMIIKKL